MTIDHDKKRIASTVILGVVLVISLIFTFIFIGTSWADLKAIVDSSSSSQETASGQVASAFAVALAGSIWIIFIVGIYFAILISGLICLPFSIRNVKSTLLGIRIVSFIYDGLFAFTITASIVKIILFFLGI